MSPRSRVRDRTVVASSTSSSLLGLGECAALLGGQRGQRLELGEGGQRVVGRRRGVLHGLQRASPGRAWRPPGGVREPLDLHRQPEDRARGVGQRLREGLLGGGAAVRHGGDVRDVDRRGAVARRRRRGGPGRGREVGDVRVRGQQGRRVAASAAATLTDLPEDLRGPFAAFSDETIPVASFPYGAHVCEVEIDPETGTVEIVRYSAVDDVGRAVNPMIIHGQVHGGIAQGVGQALLEHCHDDPETGQLLSGSFMDYAMPRAENFPFFATESSEVPCTTHPLGIPSGRRRRHHPALGAVINAVVDALSEFGVKHIEMPATPDRVWRAIQEAKAQA